jgi:hypothetical protein
MQIFNVIFFILWATQKWQNLIKFGEFEYIHTQIHTLSFLWNQKYEVFGIDISQVRGINIGYIWKKIKFFETHICDFLNFLKQQDHWYPGAKNFHSQPNR